MEKYEAYEFFSTVDSPKNIKVPEFTDLSMWTDFFVKLVSYDVLAPVSVCVAMICFDMFECVPDTPYRRFYFELGLKAMDDEKRYIAEGAYDAGFVERGIIDLVNFAVGGTMPEEEESFREAICQIFEHQTYYLKFLSTDQIEVAHRFAYPRRKSVKA